MKKILLISDSTNVEFIFKYNFKNTEFEIYFITSTFESIDFNIIFDIIVLDICDDNKNFITRIRSYNSYYQKIPFFCISVNMTDYIYLLYQYNIRILYNFLDKEVILTIFRNMLKQI